MERGKRSREEEMGMRWKKDYGSGEGRRSGHGKGDGDAVRGGREGWGEGGNGQGVGRCGRGAGRRGGGAYSAEKSATIWR